MKARVYLAALAFFVLMTPANTFARGQIWDWMIGRWNCTNSGNGQTAVMVWRDEGRPVGTLANAPITFVSGDAQAFRYRTVAGSVVPMIKTGPNTIVGQLPGSGAAIALACARVTMYRAP